MRDGNEVLRLYEMNLQAATEALREIPIAGGNSPKIAGVNGWVFEQVIAHCTIEEMGQRGITIVPDQQFAFAPRVRADLRFGRVLVEIKLRGLFGSKDIAKYRRYRALANDQGMTYLYLTGGETYQPYRTGIEEIFGTSDAFFLDTPGDWNRYVTRLASLLSA